MIKRFLMDPQRVDEQLRERIQSKSIRVVMGVFFLDTEAKMTSLKFLKEVDIQSEEEENPRLDEHEGTPDLPLGKKKRTRRGTRGKGRKINYKMSQPTKAEVVKDVARNAVEPETLAEAETQGTVQAQEHKPEETVSVRNTSRDPDTNNNPTWNGTLKNNFLTLFPKKNKDKVNLLLADKSTVMVEEESQPEEIQDRMLESMIEQLLSAPIKDEAPVNPMSSTGICFKMFC